MFNELENIMILLLLNVTRMLPGSSDRLVVATCALR